MADDLKILNLNGGVLDATDMSLASAMLDAEFEPSILRPYVNRETGKKFVDNMRTKQHVPVTNALLYKDEWQAIDAATVPVYRDRLRFVRDLETLNLVKVLPNALGISQYQYQASSDISDATASMSPTNNGNEDQVELTLRTLPIPLIMKPFSFDIRQLATNRRFGGGIDTFHAEQAMIKVAETMEKLHLGTYGTYQFGGANLYGLRNFDSRITTTYADWAGGTKTAKQRVTDLLTFINTMRDNKQYGPFGIYVGANLERYLDEDYNDTYGVITLRERILKVGVDKERTNSGDVSSSIRFIRALDYLENDDIIVVSFGNRSIRTIQGMTPRIVQWSEKGGMVAKFVAMAIQLPFIVKDYNNKVGILHATKA